MTRSRTNLEQIFETQIQALALTLRLGSVDNYRSTARCFLPPGRSTRAAGAAPDRRSLRQCPPAPPCYGDPPWRMHPFATGLPAAGGNRTVGAPCPPRQTTHGTFGSGRSRGAADRGPDPHPAHFVSARAIRQFARLPAPTSGCYSARSGAESPIGVGPGREARWLLNACDTAPSSAQLRDRNAPARS